MDGIRVWTWVFYLVTTRIWVRDMACEACTVLNSMREHWWSALAALAESPLFCCYYLLTSVTEHPTHFELELSCRTP
jgi:hypothetical protein